MDYGFAFLSAVDIHKDLALAERRGFTHAGRTTPDDLRGRVSVPGALRSQDRKDQARHQCDQPALSDRAGDRQ